MKYDAVIAVRCSQEQRRQLEAAAQRAGLELSSWLRVVTLRAAGETELLQQLTRTTETTETEES